MFFMGSTFAAHRMENPTLIGVIVFYGLALLLFFGAVLFRHMNRFGGGSVQPPAMPFGKVAIWPYRNGDLLGIVAIAGFFFLMATSNAVVSMEKELPKITAFALFFNIGLQFFLAGLAIIAVLSRIKPVHWLGLSWKEWPWVFLLAPAAVVSMWAVFAGLYAVGYMELLENVGLQKVQDTVKILQEEQDMVILVLMAFTAAIVAPVCEEIVFRGYLYPAAKKFAGPWVAAICTALVFSAAHGNFAALVPLFIFGLLLVALYEATGSIWAPIATHFCFNSATLIVQMLVRFGLVSDVPAS
ncbi:MAG: lysostaphin resistance A-like protein [Akkermansiaceae bacterium]